MRIMRQLFRNEWKAKLAGVERASEVATDKVTRGTEWHDAVAITGAVAIIGGLALIAEHEYHFDGDVIYDMGAMVCAHPLSRGIKAALLALF